MLKVGLVLLMQLCTISCIKYLVNVDCGSYVDYVATDPDLHRFTPYYVKLHRCHGANIGANPRNKKCLPVQLGVKNLDITVFDGPMQSIKAVENHTLCEERCTLEPSDCTPYQQFQENDCACLCNFTNTPNPNPCVKPFYWDQTNCDCKCSHKTLTCGARREFNKDICGCTCKGKIQQRCRRRGEYLDESSCSCVDPKVITGASRGQCEGEIKGGILAVIMIVEGLAFIIAYFFLYVYCYKQKYLPKKALKKNNSYYYNGDIANNRPSNEVNITSVVEEDFSEKLVSDDKKLIQKEEENVREKENLVNYPVYYPEDEKSHLATKKSNEWYMYNDIMEVDGPSRGSVVESDKLTAGYTDYHSELSEDGYGSVTQV